jgi:hypothetical protein
MFNLGNKCDINFGFTVAKDVHVFITAFSAFIFGMLFTLPFIFGSKSRTKEKKPPKEKKAAKKTGGSDGDYGSNNGHYGID